MARIYSRKKGKSKSTKPIEKKPYTWVSYSPQEVEHLVLKLAKTGLTSEKIGAVLKDTYGIPLVKSITNKPISSILKEHYPQKIPQDLISLIKKTIQTQKHLEKFKKDEVARRGLLITESKIKRLVKYYKKANIIPKDFEYTKGKAKLLVE